MHPHIKVCNFPLIDNYVTFDLFPSIYKLFHHSQGCSYRIFSKGVKFGVQTEGGGGGGGSLCGVLHLTLARGAEAYVGCYTLHLLGGHK